MGDTFLDEDLNGECFILGSEGEREFTNANTAIAIVAGDQYGPGIVKTQAQLNAFFYDQVEYMRINAAPLDANFTAQNYIKVAYIRTIAARMGLIDTVNPAAHHNCTVQPFVIIPAHHNPTIAQRNAFNLALTANIKAQLREKFTNMVCAVAYIFRIRGHHYMDAFEPKYVGVWRRSMYDEDNPGLSWKYVSIHALHCIYPDTLDVFWRASVLGDRCSGTLNKRFACAPAGVAGVYALKKGVDDILTVFPTLRNRQQEACDHLADILTQVEADRWAGSVNRRFYNAPLIAVNESLLSSLAALILGALHTFQPTAPLAASFALRRIAGNAPIVTGVMERVLEKAADRDEMVQAVVPIS